MVTEEDMALASFYKALSEPSRLLILKDLLKEGERCVCMFGDVIGKDVSVVSRHVRILEDSGLIKTRKKGTSIYCTLADEKKIKTLLKKR